MKNADIADVVSSLAGDILGYCSEWIPGGILSGDEYVALNPLRSDSHKGSFSINVKTGVWGEFATGDKGRDLVSLYAYLNGINNGQAANSLDDRYNLGLKKDSTRPPLALRPIQNAQEHGNPKLEDKFISPVPKGAPLPPTKLLWEQNGYKEYVPADEIYTYRNLDGEVIGYVLRANATPEREKIIRQVTLWLTPNGVLKWKFKHFPKQRPLYGLDLLKQFPDHKVLVVEGEKCVDAGNAAFNDFGWVVVSWPGGANAVKYADFSPIGKRDCVLWPDNDEIGRKAMNIIKNNKSICGKTLTLSTILEENDKSDLVDVLKTSEIIDIVNDFEHSLGQGQQLPNVFSPDPESKLEIWETLSDNRYFSAEGISGGEEQIYSCFYFMKNGNVIVPIRADRHSSETLGTLAPMKFFERILGDDVPLTSKGEIDYRGIVGMCKQKMINTCCEIGQFNLSSRRGRGVWRDGEHIVLHLGDRLYVDGEKRELNSMREGFRYRACVPIPFEHGHSATGKEGSQFHSICKLLPWEKNESAYLFAGWAFLAPICGLLKWRPSLWVYGERGSGKTYIGEEILTRLLGDFGVYCKGESSEAGIRQSLGNDALPVVFDEAERMAQNILDMVRQSSNGGRFAKLRGTTGGIAQRYDLNATFCMLAIAPIMEQAADTSRISLLELRKRNDRAAFEKLEIAVKETMTKEYAYSLQLRAINMFPVIQESIRAFSNAVVSQFSGDSRMSDQYGTLLAGAWCLKHDKAPTETEALALVGQFDWQEAQETNADTDAEQCLRILMQHVTTIRVNAGTVDNFGTVRVNSSVYNAKIGTLVAQLYKTSPEVKQEIPLEIIDKELRSMGLWVKAIEKPDGNKDKHLLIANKHDRLKKEIFDKTSWPVNWNKVLVRLTSGECFSPNLGFRFSSGDKATRALAIPAQDLFGEMTEEEWDELTRYAEDSQ